MEMISYQPEPPPGLRVDPVVQRAIPFPEPVTRDAARDTIIT